MTCRLDEVAIHRSFRYEGEVYCSMQMGNRHAATLLREIGDPIVARIDNALFFFMDGSIEVECIEESVP